MRRLSVITVAFFVAGLSNSFAENLNVKPGLWEMTIVQQNSGMPPIPKDVLKTMPAEQRAKFEAMIAQQSGQKMSHVMKECVTQKDLEKPIFDKNEDKTCKADIVKQTSNHVEIKMTCDGDGQKMSGSMIYDAPDAEHMVGKTVMAMAGDGAGMTMNMTMNGKWLGANCGDVK